MIGYNEATELYESAMKKYLRNDDSMKFLELYGIMKQVRDGSMEKYQSIAGIREKNEFYNDYRDKLKKYIDEKETRIFEMNDDIAIG